MTKNNVKILNGLFSSERKKTKRFAIDEFFTAKETHFKTR